MVKYTSFLHHNRAQIYGFVSPIHTVERSIPHFTRGGNTPIAPPAVLNPGGLANTGLWRLKSATWDAPHFRVSRQAQIRVLIAHLSFGILIKDKLN